MIILTYTVFVTFLLANTFNENTLMNNRYLHRYFICMFIIVSTYMVVITEVDFVDRVNYTRHFILANGLPLTDYLSAYTGDYLFYITTWIIAKVTQNVQYFYALLHLLFLFILIKGVKKIYGNFIIGLTLFIYLNYSFYYSYTLNVLRQGIAISLLVLAIAYLLRNKGLRFFLTIGVASLFHLSSVFFSMVLFFLYLYKKVKISWSLVAYVFSSFLFVTQLSDNLISLLPFDLNYLETYGSQEIIQSYGGSYNINFFIFNTVFLFIFIFALYKNEKLKFNNVYKSLLIIYILFSSLFFILGFVAFADRIAGYSWLLIPLIIAIIIQNTKSNINKVVFLSIILLIGVFTTPILRYVIYN